MRFDAFTNKKKNTKLKSILDIKTKNKISFNLNNFERLFELKIGNLLKGMSKSKGVSLYYER